MLSKKMWTLNKFELNKHDIATFMAILFTLKGINVNMLSKLIREKTYFGQV